MTIYSADFGDYLYIIIAIIIFVVNAISKSKKKKEQTKKPTSNLRLKKEEKNMWEELEDLLEGTEEAPRHVKKRKKVKKTPKPFLSGDSSETRKHRDMKFVRYDEFNKQEAKNLKIIEEFDARDAIVYSIIMERRF